MAPANMRAMSAGSKPAGYVHPRSIALLQSKGIAAEGYFSKSWNDLPTTPDIVITVCGSAAGETCPAYLGSVLRAHWGVEDPAKASVTDVEIDAAFMQAYTILYRRIKAFLDLPSEELGDKTRLARRLAEIGEL